MKKLTNELKQVLREQAPTESAHLIALRIQEVQQRFKWAIEHLFHEHADFVLSHVNSVYITKDKKSRKTPPPILLIVYCDDASVRTAIQDQQHFIVLALSEHFHETIDGFKALPSRFAMKERHPFYKEDIKTDGVYPPRNLTNEEKGAILEWGQKIENETLRNSFMKAVAAKKRRESL